MTTASLKLTTLWLGMVDIGIITSNWFPAATKDTSSVTRTLGFHWYYCASYFPSYLVQEIAEGWLELQATLFELSLDSKVFT